MEGRKLQKVGYSTLSVSLPSRWIKRFRLKKGDTVVCSYEKDGSLRLMPSEMAESKGSLDVAVNLDLCDSPTLLERLVVGCYIVGYDTITVFSRNKIHGDWLTVLRNVSQRLIGLSIMDERPDAVVLQCTLDPSSIPLTTMMRRLYALTATMYTEVLEALMGFDPTPAKEVVNRESEANMLYWLILRVIELALTDVRIAEKVGVQNQHYLPTYRVVIKYLEAIADYLEEAASNILQLIELNKKPNEAMVKELQRIGKIELEVFSGAFESLITGDLHRANKSVEDRMRLKDDAEEIVTRILRETEDPEIAVHIKIVSRAFNRIAEIGASMAHLAINMYVSKPSKMVMPTDSGRLPKEKTAESQV